MADLGFSRVELSHGIRVSLVPGILKAVGEGWIAVSSIHNFCPLPSGVLGAAPNLYQPTGRDRREREQWVRQTKRSLDFASQVGATMAVLHGGSFSRFLFNPEKQWIRLIRPAGDGAAAGQAGSNSLPPEAKAGFLARMERYAAPAMERLRQSLSLVSDHAREKGVRLGLENREGISELPLDQAWGPFLEKLGAPEVFGYWHDCGHAQMKDQAGLVDHLGLLKATSSRLLGWHLHDLNEAGRDHQVPGTGSVPWRDLARHFAPEHHFVLELSPRVPAREVAAAAAFLETLLPDQM